MACFFWVVTCYLNHTTDLSASAEALQQLVTPGGPPVIHPMQLMFCLTVDWGSWLIVWPNLNRSKKSIIFNFKMKIVDDFFYLLYIYMYTQACTGHRCVKCQAYLPLPYPQETLNQGDWFSRRTWWCPFRFIPFCWWQLGLERRCQL